MKRLLVLFAVADLTRGVVTHAEEYDFFSGARYPGAGRAPGVDLYDVAQEGGASAEGYKRRVVNWWPRRGVDIIEIEEGMPPRNDGGNQG